MGLMESFKAFAKMHLNMAKSEKKPPISKKDI